MNIHEALFGKLFPDLSASFEESAFVNSQFIYYTSAETAMNILKSRELWFRNARVMNDYEEILYGCDLLSIAFRGGAGERLRNLIDRIFPNASSRIDEAFELLHYDWVSETYIACPSMYNNSEDMNGRLSMWRAYGDVAFVIQSTPMKESSWKLGVYSMPVQYLTESEAVARIEHLVSWLESNEDALKSIDEDDFCNVLLQILNLFVIAVKRPEFVEEREWRLYFRPNYQPSPAMVKKIVAIDGVVQKIWALQLRHSPDEGLYRADIPSLLDHIIIGPMKYPAICKEAMRELLSDLGVTDAESKVIISPVSLRTD